MGRQQWLYPWHVMFNFLSRERLRKIMYINHQSVWGWSIRLSKAPTKTTYICEEAIKSNSKNKPHGTGRDFSANVYYTMKVKTHAQTMSDNYSMLLCRCDLRFSVVRCRRVIVSQDDAKTRFINCTNDSKTTVVSFMSHSAKNHEINHTDPYQLLAACLCWGVNFNEIISLVRSFSFLLLILKLRDDTATETTRLRMLMLLKRRGRGRGGG